MSNNKLSTYQCGLQISCHTVSLSPLMLEPSNGRMEEWLVRVIKRDKTMVDPNLDSKKCMRVFDWFCIQLPTNSRVHSKREQFQLQRHCKLGLCPTTSLELCTLSSNWYHSYKHIFLTFRPSFTSTMLPKEMREFTTRIQNPKPYPYTKQ